jgi:phosphoglycolate phosphatase
VREPRAEAIVFDLDGTLLDTRAVHLACLRATAAAVGLPGLSPAQLMRAQRGTDTETIAALVGPSLAASAADFYQDMLRARLSADPVGPMPGVIPTLRRLNDLGIRTGVCTGRSRDGAAAMLRQSGLDVQLLVAREDSARPKPAPDGLLGAIRLLTVAPDSALFVGDSSLDAAQGLACGIRTVLVSASVRPAPGIRVVRTIAEVLT